MELIRGISGIRGIVGDNLTDSVVMQHIQAFSEIQGKGEILIARDSRPHGDSFIDAGCKALSQCGRNAVNYGVIPTPTAQFLVEKNKMAGGIVITASHNPTQWNGLKFIDADGCFLNGEKNNRLFEIADRISSSHQNSGSFKKVDNGFQPHIEHTLNLSIIDSKAVKNRTFSVVVDAVNGAGSLALPEMVEALGCKVHRLFCEPNGEFLRGPEPLAKNLKKLGDSVKFHNADVGFATDPDGDRLAVVDENGNPLSEEYTLVICADGFLNTTNSSNPLVTNLSSTLALDKVAEKYGCSVIRSAVGEINVVNKMKEVNAELGGEGNGGVILPESHYGRDSLVAAAMFLHRMAQDTQKVSEIFTSMPQFVMVKDKIGLGSVDPQSILDKIEQYFSDAKPDKTDGLKLSWENSWIHIRKSNTEPIIRIYAEAATQSEVEELVEKVKLIL
ncbi:MAG: phosphoglucosamine mutase [Candidatus Marinimicrobia bacterium]|nr:phosphoglucosamine mutase [Candidatus Neomarinimicrobiota bacterium]